MKKAIIYQDFCIFENGKLIKLSNGHVYKAYTDHKGYIKYAFTYNKKLIRKGVHQLLAMAFIPNPNNFPVINHKDGNKQNNSLSNLEWCTVAYNNLHARKMLLNNVAETNKQRWNNPVFREKTSQNISKSRIKLGVAKEDKNPNFKYYNLYNGKIVSSSFILHLLKIAPSTFYQYRRENVHNNKKIEIFEKNKISFTLK